jgi:hypothetical protein
MVNPDFSLTESFSNVVAGSAKLAILPMPRFLIKALRLFAMVSNFQMIALNILSFKSRMAIKILMKFQ